MKKIYSLLLLLGVLAFLIPPQSANAQCLPRVATYSTYNMAPNSGCSVFRTTGIYSPGTYFLLPMLQGGSYRVSTCGLASIDTQITGFQGLNTASNVFHNDDSGPDCSASLQASVDYTSTFTDYSRIAVQQYNCRPGGTASISVKIRQNNNLTRTNSSASMCQGQTRTLTATPARVTTSPPSGAGNVGTFTGTGVSGITFTAPTPAGSSSNYTNTYTFGYCTANQTITVFRNPSAANAGPNQTVCSSSATLGANNPTYGSGTWSIISGPGTVTSPTSPTTTVTGLSSGTPTTLRWTVSNGPCTASTDNVVITRDATPTPANAGPNQTVCSSSASLAGNAPAVGTGTWTLVGGSGSVTSPNNPNSGVTGLSVGNNTFRWTISNGTCTSSTDDVVITRDATPTPANAGPNQNVCSASASLAGNAASVGTGTWTLIGGSGTITAPNNPNSGVTGLGVGTNTFRWTISNGTCPSSTDDVVITRDATPSTASAGPNQTICATTATLAGNTPTVGTGTWTLVGGSGTVTSPNNPSSGVTGLATGVNTFRWTISNGSCPSSTDDIAITVDPLPSTSNAGPDQNVCAATATLAGNTPAVGNGTWTLVGGTGTITSPGSPNSGVTGLGVGTNTFRWTITNGGCTPSTDDVVITRDQVPTASNAGPDQTVCATSATLAGNSPTVGTGTWTLVSGTGSITTPSSPSSGVTGLGAGANIFRWTISNGSCTASTDDVVITRDAGPTPSNAGPDQSVCASTATLAGNTPTVGTGTWTLVSGAGTITNANSANSAVTGLGAGANTFRWTIANGTCTASTDDVVITRDNPPTFANAGPDQSICVTNTSLAGNLPAVGTGAWSLVSGSGTITSPGTGNSSVTGLGAGANTFRWTISNGVCPPSFDDVDIVVEDPPSTSNAGPDQNICGTTATLAGNTPTVGTGTWTVVGGTGTITSPTDPASGITGLGIGANTFRWTISNGSCTDSEDDVVITRDETPTPSNAGPDQSICVTNATLAGNSPTVGTGTWSLVSGSGTITTPGTGNTTVTGLGLGTNTFRWTISNGVCTASVDDVDIVVEDPPSTSNAGPDQNICGTSATLAGNTPTVGTGSWTIVSGSGTITNPADPASGVTGLGSGANTFRWTISNGSCTVSEDDVVITRDDPPSPSNAGPDQTVCGGVANLAGNMPVTGAGNWTLLSGAGTVTNPADPTSSVTGLGVGTNSFTWTISSGSCPSSTDTVIINSDALPTVSNAGTDQAICSGNATLAANTPTIGTGSWSVIAGSATVTTPTDPASGVTGLSIGANSFVWAISNGVCASSVDTIIITRNEVPSVSNAGPDQTVCGNVANLAGNTPSVGTGFWTRIAGGATITNLANPTSGVTNLSVGTNTFVWSIFNGTCSPSRDTVTIISDLAPSASNAGPDQTLCDTSATLAGNTPSVGTGAWTVLSGSATVTTPGDPASGVTGLGVGANAFVWTISNGVCPPEADTVTITRDEEPTLANAGPDQTVCGGSATLAGNTATVGTGAWTVLSGGATVTTPGDSASGVTGLAIGTNAFVWTISNGTCTASSDTVVITSDEAPTVANAGADQTICSSTATLAGNSATVGAGTWTVLSGGATVTTPGDSASGVTGLAIGANEFVWTISNGVCPPTSDTVVITQDEVPTVANAGADVSVCGSNATAAGNTPTVGTGTWTVLAGTATIANPADPTSAISGLGLGSNTLVWTISNGTCTASSDTVTITSDPIPADPVATSSGAVCSGSDGLYEVTAPVAGMGYRWFDQASGGTLIQESDTLAVGPLTVNDTVYVEGYDTTTGCVSGRVMSTIEVFALPADPVSNGDDTICIGEQIPPLSVTVDTNQTADWYDADSAGTLLLAGSTTFTPTALGTYYAEAHDTVTGCISAGRTAVTVSNYPAMATAFSADTTGCPTVVFTDLTTGNPASWSWDFGDGSAFSTQQNPTHTYLTRGPFTVTLTTSDNCGTDNESGNVEIKCIVGIEELSTLDQNIDIYPNPNDGTFTVGFANMHAKDLILNVIDMQGRVLVTKELSDRQGDFSADIDLTNRTRGVYFVQIYADGQTFTRKVVVQ